MPKPQRERGGSQNRGRGGGSRGRGRGGGGIASFNGGGEGGQFGVEVFLSTQLQNDEIQFRRGEPNSRGRGGGQSVREGSSNQFNTQYQSQSSYRGRGNSNGNYNSGPRGRGRGGYDNFSNIAPRSNGFNNNGYKSNSNSNSNFKGKENLKVKNAQSVPFDYSRVMATTSSFRGKGSRSGTNRNRYPIGNGNGDGDERDHQGQIEESKRMVVEEEDLETMLAKQLESENPISATEIADSFEIHQNITSSNKSKGKQRAISDDDDEDDDESNSEEDIVIEPPIGYVHILKPHLEKGYASETDEDEDEGEEVGEDFEANEGEERDIYEDDVPDLPPISSSSSISNGKSTPLFCFNSFTSSSSSNLNNSSQIQAENQRKVPIESSIESSSSNQIGSCSKLPSTSISSSIFSSTGIASIIPTGPSSSAGNRWWGAVGLPTARKTGMGTTSTSTSLNFGMSLLDQLDQERNAVFNSNLDNNVDSTKKNEIEQQRKSVEVQLKKSQLEKEEEEKFSERKEAEERAREAERVQAELIQKASQQSQGVHTGLGSSNNQTSALGSQLNPNLKESLNPMNSYSKGSDLDYQKPEKGFEIYVPSKQIGSTRRFKNKNTFSSSLTAPGAYTNERQVFRNPVTFVKATGEWKGGKFVRFIEYETSNKEERNSKDYERKGKEEAIEGWKEDEEEEGKFDPLENMDFIEDEDDPDDLMKQLQESYPGLEITMEDGTEVETSFEISKDEINPRSLDQTSVDVGFEENKKEVEEEEELGTQMEEEDEEEEILIPSTSPFTNSKAVFSNFETSTEKVSQQENQIFSQVQESSELEDELDEDEENEDLQTKLALEQSKARQQEVEEDQEPSFIIDLKGESPSEIESKSQEIINHSQNQSWTLGSPNPNLNSITDTTPQQDEKTSNFIVETSRVSPLEAATGSSSSHPRIPRDRSQGSKNRNSKKKARRRERMNKFNGKRNDDDGELLEMEENERIPREGDSDLDWGSDGPPGKKDGLKDQYQDDDDDEDERQLQDAIRESLGVQKNSNNSDTKPNQPQTRPRFTSKKGKGRNKNSNGVDDTILKDYMENALDIHSDSEDHLQNQESMLPFINSMDPQRGGRQLDSIDILIEDKINEENDWMSVSEEDEDGEEEIEPNGINSTLTKEALEKGTSPGNLSDSNQLQEQIKNESQFLIKPKAKGGRKEKKVSNNKINGSNLGKFGALVQEESDEEMVDQDSQDSDSDDSELDRALRKSERMDLGLDSESESDDSDDFDSDSDDDDDDDEDEDDEDGIGMGTGRGSNNRLKGSKRGKNAWTWAQEDEEVADALEAFAASHHDTLTGRDRKARNRLFKAIERGDFGSIDLKDMELDPEDPAYGVTGAVRGVKGGRNRSKKFDEDELWAEELQSQWQKDKAKKAAAKKNRQAEREAAAQNAFKNTHGKKKGSSKAARRAEKRARKATEAGVFIQGDDDDDDEDDIMLHLDSSFGGKSLGLSTSKKFNQKISSNPTLEGDYLRQAQSLQEVNEQIQIFLKTSGHSTLVLPSMDKRARAQVHLLAGSYNLKSVSKGSGNDRFPTLIKTSRSGQNIDHKRINGVLSGRSDFKFGSSDNRFKIKNGKKEKKTVGATGGGSMAPKNREGDQVGFGADKIGSENVGHKLLSMMGWNEGKGLGSQKMEGSNEPVGAMVKINKGGLGF